VVGATVVLLPVAKGEVVGVSVSVVGIVTVGIVTDGIVTVGIVTDGTVTVAGSVVSAQPVETKAAMARKIVSWDRILNNVLDCCD